MSEQQPQWCKEVEQKSFCFVILQRSSEMKINNERERHNADILLIDSEGIASASYLSRCGERQPLLGIIGTA
jgi:hypothetical protein